MHICYIFLIEYSTRNTIDPLIDFFGKITISLSSHMNNEVACENQRKTTQQGLSREYLVSHSLNNHVVLIADWTFLNMYNLRDMVSTDWD